MTKYLSFAREPRQVLVVFIPSVICGLAILLVSPLILTHACNAGNFVFEVGMVIVLFLAAVASMMLISLGKISVSIWWVVVSGSILMLLSNILYTTWIHSPASPWPTSHPSPPIKAEQSGQQPPALPESIAE